MKKRLPYGDFPLKGFVNDRITADDLLIMIGTVFGVGAVAAGALYLLFG